MEIEIKREERKKGGTVLRDPDTSFSYLERVRGGGESETARGIVTLK